MLTGGAAGCWAASHSWNSSPIESASAGPSFAGFGPSGPPRGTARTRCSRRYESSAPAGESPHSGPSTCRWSLSRLPEDAQGDLETVLEQAMAFPSALFKTRRGGNGVPRDPPRDRGPEDAFGARSADLGLRRVPLCVIVPVEYRVDQAIAPTTVGEESPGSTDQSAR